MEDLALVVGGHPLEAPLPQGEELDRLLLGIDDPVFSHTMAGIQRLLEAPIALRRGRRGDFYDQVWGPADLLLSNDVWSPIPAGSCNPRR